MESNNELEKNVLDLVVDGADVAIDLITENELLKDIPVIGIPYKALKTLNSISDKVFLYKVGRFLKGVNDKTTSSARTKFAEEIKKDKDKRDELYSAVFIKIDKFDDISKSDLFAKIFASFLVGKIRKEDFFSLASALNLTSIGELKSFSQAYWQDRIDFLKSVYYLPENNYGNLLSTNLVTIALDQKHKSLGEGLRSSMSYNLKFEITELGCLYVYIADDFEDYFSFLTNEEKNYAKNYFYERNYSFEATLSNEELRNKVQRKWGINR